MKIRIILLILLLCAANIIYGDVKKAILPQLDRYGAAQEYFSSPEEAEKYLKTNKKSSDYFKTGYYYYCHSFTLYDNEKKNKKKITSFMEKASDYLVKASEMEPDNAVYLAVYGIAYMQWGYRKGFIRMITTSKKAINYINKAVNMEPENLDIRLIRLTTFTYFSYKYYKQYKPMIQDDEKMIVEWIDDLDSLNSKDNNVKETLDKKWDYATDRSARDEVYFCIGRYYYTELNDKNKGNEYFFRINKDSAWFKMAEQEKEKADKAGE